MVHLALTNKRSRPYEAVREVDDHGIDLPVDSDARAVDCADAGIAPASKGVRRRSTVTMSLRDVELAVVAAAQEDEDDFDEDDRSPREEQEGSRDLAKKRQGVEDAHEPIDPFSYDYVGISASYFTVGLLGGGSVSLLYPVLVVKGGASSSFVTASTSAVMIFWSYKILFGFLSDW